MKDKINIICQINNLICIIIISNSLAVLSIINARQLILPVGVQISGSMDSPLPHRRLLKYQSDKYPSSQNKNITESNKQNMSRDLSKNKRQIQTPDNNKSYHNRGLNKKAYRCAYVYDLNQDKPIIKYNSTQKQQIASLTKIMTCWIAIKYIYQERVAPQNIFFQVSAYAANMKGTTAELQEGDIISLWDLMFGLMLPSGNDAATCIAQNIGKHYRLKFKKSQDEEERKKSPSRLQQRCAKNNALLTGKGAYKDPQINMNEFISIMNRQAKILQMEGTQFTNPHGLQDISNYSNCSDLTTLIKEALKDALFTRIINKKLYFACVRQKSSWTRQIIWENTNRLLNLGYSGIKTGNTVAAGFCLASWYKNEEHNLIVIVLGTKNRQQRDQQSIKLTNKALRQIKKQPKIDRVHEIFQNDKQLSQQT